MPMIGEVRLFAASFAPAGWNFCDGTLLPIAENEALFQVIGTTYGGDGQATFALPDLRSRVPVHQGQSTGSSYQTGETGGVEAVTVTTQQMPIHTHPFLVSSDTGAQIQPGGNGQTNFALPNLRGRIPLHWGNSLSQGTVLGEEAHTLTIGEMPNHTHTLSAANADGDDTNTPANMLGAFNNGYRGATNLIAIQTNTITNVGGSQPHENRQPFLTMNWCVALVGIFPSQN